jgi:hypothetical protein
MIKNGSLKGKKIVLTGKFRHSARKDAEAELKKHGATTASSVSAKTDLVIAGAAAGSKLYDAHRLGVPILAEGHLQRLLGGAPLADVIALARTFYTLESVDAPPPGSLSVLGGAAPGVSAARWPRLGDVTMQHLMTLDLATVPALQVHYPDQRTLSIFCAADRDLTMYDIGNPNNGLVVPLFSTQAQIDERPAAPAVPSLPPRWFRPVVHAWDQIGEKFGRARVLGGVPCWCQSEQHQGNFIMQCGEDLGISGDGLVYVFDDKVFAQFT